MSSACFFFSKTLTDSLNVCNIVKYDTCNVFASTHNSISFPKDISCLENDNITNCHLPLTNLLSSSETKSPSSLTKNLNFSECFFSLPEISSRIFHHVSSSAKFSLFFMILFNAMLLHQPIQNALILIFWQILLCFN